MDLSVNLGSTPYYLWLWASPLTSLRSHFLTCEIRTIVKPTSQLLNERNSTIYAEDIARDQAHGEYAQMRAPVLGINGTCLTNCKYEKKPERTITLLFLAWCCEGKQRQSGKEVLICWVCSPTAGRQFSSDLFHFFASCCVCQKCKALTLITWPLFRVVWAMRYCLPLGSLAASYRSSRFPGLVSHNCDADLLHVEHPSGPIMMPLWDSRGKENWCKYADAHAICCVFLSIKAPCFWPRSLMSSASIHESVTG